MQEERDKIKDKGYCLIEHFKNGKKKITLIILLVVIIIILFAGGLFFQWKNWEKTMYVKKVEKDLNNCQKSLGFLIDEVDKEEEELEKERALKNEENEVQEEGGVAKNFLGDCLRSFGECLYIKENNEIIKVEQENGKSYLNRYDVLGNKLSTLLEQNFLYDVNEGDKKLELIGYSDEGKYVYYSPDQPDGLGGAFIFGGIYGGLNRIETDTKKIKEILKGEDVGIINNISKNGKYVVYETYIGENSEIPYYYPTSNKKPDKFNGLIIMDMSNRIIERKISHREEYQRFGNLIFSPDSKKIVYEEYKKEKNINPTNYDPGERQYDTIVENTKDGSNRIAAEECVPSSSNWQINENPWIDNRYLIVSCLDGNYYKLDTENNGDKELLLIKPY